MVSFFVPDFCGIFFFIVVYIHLAQGLYYGSYKNMQEMIWVIGIFVYIIMMVVAFFRYVLVRAMMSISLALVVTGFLKVIPFFKTW
ncbi:ubiquinol-cytochrome c reductase cytochrome b subunit [Bartonella sp. AR 15-3]|nr:ubiquinol-cytochrome c reductase cytochrome b subunit [Bartonella sp. AR 15-3]